MLEHGKGWKALSGLLEEHLVGSQILRIRLIISVHDPIQPSDSVFHGTAQEAYHKGQTQHPQDNTSPQRLPNPEGDIMRTSLCLQHIHYISLQHTQTTCQMSMLPVYFARCYPSDLASAEDPLLFPPNQECECHWFLWAHLWEMEIVLGR